MNSSAEIYFSKFATAICGLGLKNQHLIERSIDLGAAYEIKQLQNINKELVQLLYKSSTFDFVNEIIRGRTLFVGEGNLSFALSIANMSLITPNRLIATTFEAESALSEEAIENADKSRKMGVTVICGVDATKLSATFGSWLFDNIIFQFPNVGSREAVENHNPNFILLRDFLTSAISQLYRTGKVIITTVDNPHYRGAFQFEEAAKITGFKSPEIYQFDPFAFSGYEHTMTHQTGSAIDKHDKFSTWVFRV